VLHGNYNVVVEYKMTQTSWVITA